jgi:PD-(D/E)XK nuclease superfamily
VEFSEKWVQSQTIQFDGLGSCYIRGRFDVGLKFDDGSFGIVDFKTANPRDSHIRLYSWQLHGYAPALEKAAPGKFCLSPVNVIGLLCVEPKHMAGFEETNFLIGKAQWIPIQRDDEAFEEFLREVVSLLAQPTPPPLNPHCDFCMYRSRSGPGERPAQPLLPFLERSRVRRAV